MRLGLVLYYDSLSNDLLEITEHILQIIDSLFQGFGFELRGLDWRAMSSPWSLDEIRSYSVFRNWDQSFLMNHPKICPHYTCIMPEYNRIQTFEHVLPLHGSWKGLDVRVTCIRQLLRRYRAKRKYTRVDVARRPKWEAYLKLSSERK